jgi:hypothetical protein
MEDQQFLCICAESHAMGGNFTAEGAKIARSVKIHKNPPAFALQRLADLAEFELIPISDDHTTPNG